MKFLSDILAKAGLTVDGVVTLNNTATGQTPAANDNSTKLATTAWVRTFVQPYSLPIASASILGGIKVGTGLSIDSGTGILSVTGGSASSLKSTQTFVVTEGQTVFTVTNGYAPGLIDIFLNGVYLSPNQSTATNGSTFTLNDPAATGDIIDVIVVSPVYQGTSTTTDQLPEGVVNLYYTNARARAAITLTVNGSSGASTYSSSTGVLNVPTYTLAGLGGIGGSGTTGYVSKFTNSTTIGNSLIYDDGFGIGINTSSPYNTSFYSLDVNGALLVKNVGKAANITLINADPAGGGNNAFVIHTVGGTLTNSYVDIQGYYGASVTGSTTIRLNAAGGNLLVGSLIGTGTRMVVASSTGILSTQDIVTYVSQVKHQVKSAQVITKGQAVYVSSADGTNMIVSKASNATEGTSSKTMGLLDASVSINGFANVVTEGLLAGLNTASANAGDPVWLGTDGNLIYGLLNKPSAPAHLVFIGIVTRANSNNGEIFVKVQNGYELDELHDLSVKNPSDGDMIKYVASTGLWTKVAASTTNIVEGTNLYYTDARVGTYLTNNSYATQSYVNTAVSNLVDAAPGTLDTLNELAAALGDDPNFATTVATSIGTKQAQLNGTGFVKVSGTTVSYDNSTYYLASNPNGYITGISFANVSAKPTTIAGYGITDSLVYTTSTYSNPSWITALAWSKITGAPAFITGYTETDTLATVTGRGASTSTAVTFNGGFNDGYITFSLAQINRSAGNVELQFASGGGVRMFGGGATPITFSTNGSASYSSSVTASSLIRSGGTSSQFLMADGSVSTNPGWLTGITSLQVTNALGFTPYNSTNPSGYVTSSNWAILGGGVSYNTDRTTKVTNGLAIYSAYTGGANSPTTYDISAQYVISGRAMEMAASWHSPSAVMYFRTLRDCCDNWSAWVTMLSSANYNDYAPTKTGGGASGSWGISVTGSAGSVAWTNVTSRPTALSSFTNDLGNYGGWITGYTETDTLATVTARGASTSTAITTGGLTVNTGGAGTWGPFVVTSTSLWGDGTTQYVTIGAGGAAGIMIYNPHIVWNSGSSASALRMGRSGGVSSGAWYEIGTGASDNFFIAKNGLSAGTQFNINSSGNATFSGTLSASNLSGTNTGDQTNISGNAGSATRLGAQSVNLNTGRTPGTLEFYDQPGGTGAPNGNWHNYISTRHGNAANQYGFQIANEFGTETLLFRGWDGSNPLSWRTVWHSGSLTNLSQLTNGPGYITGITSSMVTNALGYTPMYQASRSGINVNAFNDTGLYRGSTGDWSNRPTVVHNGGALLQIDTHPGGYHSQLFFDSGGNRLYMRSADVFTWGSWVTMWHTGNLTNLNQLSNGPGYIANGASNVNFFAGFSAYTTDGLFSGNARPFTITTPNGDTRIRLGYNDYGGGQYYGRIGFNGPTAWSIGHVGSAGNDFSIGIGHAGEMFKITNGGDYIFQSGSSGTSGKVIFKTADNSDLNKYIMQDGYWTVIGTHSNEGFRVRDHNGNILLNVAGSSNGYPLRVGIGTTTPGYKLHVAGDMFASSNIFVGADGSSGYVASRIWLYSHNNYRGAGVYMSGTGSTWFAGTGYTDFDGRYIISRRGVAGDDSTAWNNYAVWSVTSGGGSYQTGDMSASSVHAYAATGRVVAGSWNFDGMLFDSSRSALIARGNYPHIELWSDVSNSNHGGTLRFGGYDNGSSGAYKSWNIGTPGSDLYFLDIGYGGYNSNPHAGIAGLGASYGYPGAFTAMRFHNNGNVGVGNYGTYGFGDNTPAYKFDVRGTGRFTDTVYANNLLLVNTTTQWNQEKFGIQISNSASWSSVPAMMRLTNNGAGNKPKITFTDSAIIDGWLGMVPVSNASYFVMGFSGYTEEGFRVYQNGSAIVSSTLTCDTLNSGNYINIGYNRNGESVATSAFRGIDFHTTGDFNYYIGKPAGSWTQPLHIHFYTGVRLRAHSSYGGTQFFNINGSVTTATVNDGDNHLRGFYDIIAYASDKRLKHNIKPIENALDKVRALTGMTYQWNKVGNQYGWEPDTEVREAGVFAQDVEAVLPEAVKLAPFDNENGISKSGENFLTVKYEKIVPLLIEAIKEQQGHIESQKTEIEELKDLVKQLINR